MTSKRIRMGVIFVAVLAGGCTSTRILPSQAPQVAYREANDRLGGRNAQIRTTDGTLHELYNVQIATDSVRGFSPFGGQGSQFGQDRVFEIQTGKDRTRGGLVGGAIGVGIGLILLVLGAYDDQPASGDWDWPVEAMPIVTGTWGVIIGAIRGSRTQYRFGR
jgi:hypothetical protein